jgi:hypothetical protein
LHRRSREFVHRLHGLDLQAAGTVENGVDDHTRFAGRRLVPRHIARDIARAELQAGADAAHIGFDRQAGCSGQIGEIVRPGARDLHPTLRNVALGLNTLSDQRRIDAHNPQTADPQAIAASFERSRNPRCGIAALLDQACNDDAIRPAQSGDRDINAGTTPAFVAAPDDLLAEDAHLAGLDGFNRPDDFADGFDPVGGQRAVGLAQCHNACDVSDPQRLCRCRLAIDPYRHTRGVADPFAVDENAAKALDDPDDAGATDAVIVAAVCDPRSADAMIVASFDLRPDRGRSKEPESRQQQPSGDDRLLAHD